MKICIELENIEKIDNNIEALERCLDGKPLANDFVLLVDTISILDGIKYELNRQSHDPS